jgi:putative NIF3 family GTP cyclohydrolase 1 type 2
MSHHELLEGIIYYIKIKANANGVTVVLVEHSNSERGYLSQVLMPRLQSLLRMDQGLDQANDIEIEVICSCLDKDPIEYY